MPEPLSAISLLVGYAALNTVGLGRTGVSLEARTLRDSACQVVKTTERSFSLFGDKGDAISRLLDVAEECAVADWDGEDAAPISAVAVAITAELIRSLPDRFPMPEFAVDPDGEVSVDWIESRTRLFSVIVGDSRRLAYAWLDGADRGHGVAGFDGGSLPRKIIEGVQGLFEHRDTSLRAA